MKMAYQERMIAELNTVVYEQQKTLDELKETSERLLERMLDLSQNMSLSIGGNERPPHY